MLTFHMVDEFSKAFLSSRNLLSDVSVEFFCLLSSTVAKPKLNCVLELGCQRCPIDGIGVVVFM
jgi:hypothetical protein